MYKLEKIEIGGKKYPYIIDMNILEDIQEKFGTVQKFERMILGLRETGEFEEDGYTPKYSLGEPSIVAINYIIPEMVNEGIAIEAMRAHKDYDPVEPMLLMAECNTDYHELAELVHKEFARRFQSKKSKPTESPRRRKSQ